MAKKSTAPTRSTTSNKKSSNIPTEKWLPWALAAVAVLFYFTGIRNEMVMMDGAATVDNPAVNSFSLLKQYNLGMYAPATWFGYAIAYLFGGENVFCYHLMSALVHAANVLLVFQLFRRLGSSLTIAGWVTFFFAVHESFLCLRKRFTLVPIKCPPI